MPNADRAQWSDPRWCEAEYNNRLLVPDAGKFIAAWATMSADARRRHGIATIAYGPNPREAIDLVRAENAKGVVVFIHGGYWRALSKDDFTWVATAFVDAGYSVALLGYPLTPEVTVGAIMESCRRAVVKLWSELDARERGKIVLTGHSAGGHLVADAVATDWTLHGLPASPFAGVVPISGVFELGPLVLTSMNADIRLTAGTAEAWSLDRRTPQVRAPLIFVVGGGESSEFIRQSCDQAARWASHDSGVETLILPACNHFSVLDGLRDPSSDLFRAIEQLLSRR